MKKIIFDTDMGIDDALALLLAIQSSELQLMGITTVSGNVNVNKGTTNALSLLEYCNRKNLPVARGSEKPLFKELDNAEHVHGEDGLGNINLPPPKIKAISKSAMEFLIETVTNYPNEITIVATGPLTNLATVLKTNFNYLEKAFEIVIMGGAVQVTGNVTPYAEYNVWADAEAAKIVLESGLNITLVPLDVTMSFILSTDDLDKIKTANTPISKLVSKMLPFYIDFHRNRRNLNGCYIHDALAMAFTIDQTLLKTKKMGLTVIIEKNEKYGQVKPYKSNPSLNVSLEVYSNKFLQMFIKRLVKH